MEISSFEIENNGSGSQLGVLLDKSKTKIIVFKLFQNSNNQIVLYAFAGKQSDDFLKPEPLTPSKSSTYRTDGQNIFIGDVEIGKKDNVLDKLNNCLQNHPGKNVKLKPLSDLHNGYNYLTFELDIPDSAKNGEVILYSAKANPCPPYQPL